MLRLPLNRYQAKYAILLCLLVVMILLPGTPVRREIFNVVLILVLGACVAAVGRSKARLHVALFVSAIPAISVFLPSSTPAQALAHLVCQAAFLAYATVMILMDVFKTQDVNRDKLLGSVCAYFLVGLTFAMVYLGLALWNPGAFKDADGSVAVRHDRVSEGLGTFGYFSMVTMSTVGYGDIRPVSPQARSLTVLQAVFGQFYFAVMVGRLMALYLRDLDPSRGTDEPSA